MRGNADGKYRQKNKQTFVCLFVCLLVCLFVAIVRRQSSEATTTGVSGGAVFGPDRRSRRRSRSGRSGAKNGGEARGPGVTPGGGAALGRTTSQGCEADQPAVASVGAKPALPDALAGGQVAFESRHTKVGWRRVKDACPPAQRPGTGRRRRVGAPPRLRSKPLEPTRQCGEKSKPGQEVFAESRPRVRKCAARAAH